MIRYGYSLAWHRQFGETASVSVDDCDTREEAFSLATLMAISAGWTPRRWWQFWRWGEKCPPLVEVVRWFGKDREVEIERRNAEQDRVLLTGGVTAELSSNILDEAKP